jgi:hypothetical protein
MFLACFKDISLFKYALLTIKLVVGVPHKKLIKNKHKDFLFSKSFNLLNRLNKKLFIKFKLNNKLLKTYIGIILTTTLKSHNSIVLIKLSFQKELYFIIK